MALAAAVVSHWTDGKRIHVIGTVTSSGTYSTGGDTLSLVLGQVKTNKPPLFVVVQGVGILTYHYVYGTTQANGKVFAITAGAQLAAGAYPADTITFYAIFPKFH